MGMTITYKDTGCEFADSCLNCPFPHCMEDDLRQKRHGRKQERRERIFALGAEGKGLPEIASELGISERTVYRALANKSLQGVVV